VVGSGAARSGWVVTHEFLGVELETGRAGLAHGLAVGALVEASAVDRVGVQTVGVGRAVGGGALEWWGAYHYSTTG